MSFHTVMYQINHHQVMLILVPEHQDIEDIEKADEFAVNRFLDESTGYNDVLSPLVVIKNKYVRTQKLFG